MNKPPARPINAKFDISFKENLGVNLTLENLSCKKMGDVLLLSCKNSKCNKIPAKIAKGVRKCNVKNKLKVALFTLKPPHSHKTKDGPKKGSVLTRFVITVAPQKDICPQGRT
jgi:hypothetical protein